MTLIDLDPVASVMSLLEARLGLCPEVLGRAVVEHALMRIAQEHGGATPTAISSKLTSGDHAAWRGLIEQVTVTETWFLRYPEAFVYLAEYARSKVWTPQKPIRILSVPCATGEEPYSIGITLIEAGLAPEQIRIDALDVCQNSVHLAKGGVFALHSLREPGSDAILKHGTRTSTKFRLSPTIRSLIQFREQNVFGAALRQLPHAYDAIFCRNLLIYLSGAARDRIIEDLRLALCDGGVLFVGNAELDLFARAGFSRVSHAHAFVCRKACVPQNLATRDPKFKVPGSDKKAAKSLCMPVDDEEHINSAPSLIVARRLADRGLLEPSAAMCRLLLEEDALNSGVYVLLGEISEAAGREEESERHFGRALYLDPKHYESLMHMSLACARRGEQERSENYLARARRENPIKVRRKVE